MRDPRVEMPRSGSNQGNIRAYDKVFGLFESWKSL